MVSKENVSDSCTNLKKVNSRQISSFVAHKLFKTL